MKWDRNAFWFELAFFGLPFSPAIVAYIFLWKMNLL